jgi:hypothetical protein
MEIINGEPTFMERRKGVAPPNNDPYLIDNGHLLNISREHLQINRTDGGGFHVHDRGSACGNHVDGKSIGGMDEMGTFPLEEGSEIIMGTPESPYRYSVQNLEMLEHTRRDDF